MAKKNSSKTATEKAIQSSEPKVITYKGWKGVNYVDAPLTWDPLETGPTKFRQTDLPANYLMVQNNLITTPTLGIETRDDSERLVKLTSDEISSGVTFTDVAAVYQNLLFVVAHVPVDENKFVEKIICHPLNFGSIAYGNIYLLDPDMEDNYTPPTIYDPASYSYNYVIKEIGFFENNLIVAAERIDVEAGHETVYNKLFLARITYKNNQIGDIVRGMNWSTCLEVMVNRAVATPHVQDPTTKPDLTAIGMNSGVVPSDDATIKIDIVYCYTTRMGSSLVTSTNDPATIYVEYSPTFWSSEKYLHIEIPNNVNIPEGVSGVDIYAREKENVNFSFIGHVDVNITSLNPWSFNWLGNMTDTSQWLNSQTLVPTENTTEGPPVTHFDHHDSRMYYWGQRDKLYRLYIGGNPGAEFSVARGLGGAWIDIEPGSGYEIAGTAKWKTVQGANIVTIMTGNRNTNKVRRYNLVETNLAYTNEVSYKSYMYEEVSNVVGCNSRWGYGVFDDGLYSLSRYGLMLTTMAMEYNSQMKNQDVSALIKPIFTDRVGDRLRDGRMVCIDGVIYIALSEDTAETEPINLDNVILCYDIGLQSWYTFTHDQTLNESQGSDPDKIHHIFAVDSDQYTEGLGAVTDTEVRLYPTTGIQEAKVPSFQVLIETGELIPKMPKQVFDWVEQLEFRFDYFVGPVETKYYGPNNDQYHTWPTILIEGVDYYGRYFTIEKKLNMKSRGLHNVEGEQRNYVEWVRVGKLVESLRIRIKGRARFRLTHIIGKIYTQSDRIGTPYGYDARDTYLSRHANIEPKIHHYINDYNNLRRAVVS